MHPPPAPRRVVWVLGAGFSAGLGGPILRDLLSDTSEGDLAVRYSHYPAIVSPAANTVRRLFAYGQRDRPGGGSSERLWSDAEDFIDYLDTAAAPHKGGTPNPHWDRLRHILETIPMPADAEVLRATARRLVAAECSAFLEGVDTRREQWDPYRDWAGSLTSHDTVITFNYDRVVEMLRDANDRRLAILTPSSLREDTQIFKDYCHVLKLHGSVDWRRKKSGTSWLAEDAEDPHFALKCEDDELAIGTPGPSKRDTARELGELWTRAKGALEDADAIVFVGYRFPETDAHSRKTLLSAIRGNHPARNTHHLTIHIVLGGHPQHTARLAALVRTACPQNRPEREPGSGRSFRVREHPLFAQDFFTVNDRTRLFDSPA